MGSPVARLGDTSSHGGTITTASPDVKCDGIRVARLGDSHSCPIGGHGVTALVTASATYKANGIGVCRVGDSAGCGAIINSGSPKTNAG